MRVRRPKEWHLWCIACWVLTSLSAFAAPKVSLTVVTGEPYKVGEPILLIFTPPDMPGEVKLEPPPTIKAGELQFKLRPLWIGKGIEYEAVAKRSGVFTLPPRKWKISGRRFESPGRVFKVVDAPTASATPARDGPPKPPKVRIFDSEQQLRDQATAFATPPPDREPAASPAPAGRSTPPVRAAAPTPAPVRPPRNEPFVYSAPPAVASTNVFLGQAVPVTLRFFLRADRTFQDLLRPSLAGNGFFADPMEELPPATITNNGVPYYQVTLQTTVVPLRTGPLEIPGATLQGRHTIDEPNLNSPTAGWTNFAQPSDPLQLEVAPLPTDRPADFTGGVGKFKERAPEIEPRPPAAGEPVTLRFGVEGRGNLRGMQRPVLDPASSEGWRVYDAGETVERSAADGSGSKYFEFQLIAVQDRDKTPRATLSYFDPQEKKFVRLEFGSEPLKAAAAPAVAVVPSPAPAPPAQNVLPPAAPGQPTSFDPVLQSSWFRALQILTALLFVGWICWFLARRRSGRGPAARRARLRAGYAEACDALRDVPPDRRSFYDAAAQVVVARLSVLEGKPVPREEAGRALERLVPNLAQREELAAILDRSDELNYGAVETGPLDDTERAGIVELLETFDDRAS